METPNKETNIVIIKTKGNDTINSTTFISFTFYCLKTAVNVLKINLTN